MARRVAVSDSTRSAMQSRFKRGVGSSTASRPRKLTQQEIFDKENPPNKMPWELTKKEREKAAKIQLENAPRGGGLRGTSGGGGRFIDGGTGGGETASGGSPPTKPYEEGAYYARPIAAAQSGSMVKKANEAMKKAQASKDAADKSMAKARETLAKAKAKKKK